MTTSAPNPSVSSWIASTASVVRALTVSVAPTSVSTAMIFLAPTSREPAIAASPTPPQPITATVSSRLTAPVLTAAPRPAITPQPNSPATAGSAAASTLVHWPSATSVLSMNAPMPSAGVSSVPSVSVIFCSALWVSKQYHGRPRRQARHCPHTARQLRITKSPGAAWVTPGPTDSTVPAASWPSRNGYSSVIPPSRYVRSVWQTPHAATSTTTSPGPGSGTTTSTSSTGSPFFREITPRTV